MKHNLLGISQLCDIKFLSNSYVISLKGNTILEGNMINNVDVLDLNGIEFTSSLSLKIIIDVVWIWHWRLCHTSMKIIKKITQKYLVKGIPK